MASYRVTINNKTYELPPRTLSIDEKIEDLEKKASDYAEGKLTRAQIVHAQFDFLSECVPGAFDDVEEADTNDILAATTSIIESYNAPAIKIKNEAVLAKIRPVMNSPEMKTAAAIIKAAK